MAKLIRVRHPAIREQVYYFSEDEAAKRVFEQLDAYLEIQCSIETANTELHTAAAIAQDVSSRIALKAALGS